MSERGVGKEMFCKRRYLRPLKLIASLLICLLAGVIGSVFTSSSVDTWYKTLNKPFFNPPDWIFAPVWTVLYIIMGISLFLVWSSSNISSDTKTKSLGSFGIQLFLNILWSVFFFGLKNPLLAFVEIILLWFAIIITVVFFKRISVLATVLLIPYLLWVTFASFLNYSIFIMNLYKI